MHLAQIFKFILSICLCLSLSSCSKQETITVGKWFDLVYNKMGLQTSQTHLPYFNNIDTNSYYFDIIQSLTDWDIIRTDDEFNIEDNLNQEILVKTLLRIDSIETDDYIKYAYENDIINTKNKDKVVDKQVAINLLDEYILKRNNLIFDNNSYTDVRNDIIEVKELDVEEDCITFTSDSPINNNDIITFDNQYFKIMDINEKEEITIPESDTLHEDTYKYSAIYQEASSDEVFNEIDISGQSAIDLSEAEFVDEDNEGFVEYGSNGLFTLNSLNVLKNRTFTINDYKVSINISSSRINASIEKSLKYNGKMYANLSINSIVPKYKFKMHDGVVEEAYFKVNFNTNESFGFRSGIAKDLYADFKNMNSENFIAACESLFKNYSDVIDTTIPIASIKVPVPDCPSLFLMLKLQLNIYASGRMELALSNSHELGMEVKNNNFRMIHNHDYKSDYIIKANTSTMSRLFLGLSLNNMNLMDMYCEGGIKSLLGTTVHLYDSNNQQTLIQTMLPLDFVDTLSEDNTNVYACGDIDLYLLLNVGFNSDSSLLGRLNLKKNFPILTKENSSLINNGKNHIENWQFVEKCTRNDRIKPNLEHSIIETDQIQIKDYSLLVHLGKIVKIDITGLPKGYGLKDLKFASTDSYVEVDNKGNVKGINEGSSVVTIATKDNKYEIECHILVIE